MGPWGQQAAVWLAGVRLLAKGTFVPYPAAGCEILRDANLRVRELRFQNEVILLKNRIMS